MSSPPRAASNRVPLSGSRARARTLFLLLLLRLLPIVALLLSLAFAAAPPPAAPSPASNSMDASSSSTLGCAAGGALAVAAAAAAGAVDLDVSVAVDLLHRADLADACAHAAHPAAVARRHCLRRRGIVRALHAVADLEGHLGGSGEDLRGIFKQGLKTVE